VEPAGEIGGGDFVQSGPVAGLDLGVVEVSPPSQRALSVRKLE